MAALALLALARPRWPAVRADLSRVPTGFAGIVLGAGLILGVSAGAATWVYGSPTAALARLQGVPLYAPGYVDFGTGRPGNELEREVAVTNWTAAPVRLIGGTSDCSCLTTGEMPLTIPPGQTQPVKVVLKVPGSAAGSFTRRAELWTDCDRQRTIRFIKGSEVCMSLEPSETRLQPVATNKK
jgi:hypothetical protein